MGEEQTNKGEKRHECVKEALPVLALNVIYSLLHFPSCFFFVCSLNVLARLSIYTRPEDAPREADEPGRMERERERERRGAHQTREMGRREMHKEKRTANSEEGLT